MMNLNNAFFVLDTYFEFKISEKFPEKLLFIMFLGSKNKLHVCLSRLCCCFRIWHSLVDNLYLIN